jgi:hypothetical protein
LGVPRRAALTAVTLDQLLVLLLAAGLGAALVTFRSTVAPRMGVMLALLAEAAITVVILRRAGLL